MNTNDTNSPLREQDEGQIKQKQKQESENEDLDKQHFQTVVQEQDSNLDNLDFNILEYPENRQELQRLVWSLFQKQGWLEKYNMEIGKFVKFLNILEHKYNKRNNPFHNFTHGVAVMQGCYSISRSGIVGGILDEFQVFCLVFSGLCHDVSHPAHTNIFAVNSMSKLALRYHDESPLEQHHTATTFKILKRVQLLDSMPTEQFKTMRKYIIQNILNTDNSNHQKLMQSFQQQIGRDDFGQDKSNEDSALLAGMIIHTADFIGGAKEFSISQQWSLRCNKEFERQYAEEGRLGLKQTPFMKDLHLKHVLAKGEIGFFKFLVCPLWNQLNQFMQGYLDQNVQYLSKVVENWQKISEQNKPDTNNNAIQN